MWRTFRAFFERFEQAMKPERVQGKKLWPFDVPMTLERIHDRVAQLSKSWRLLHVPVGLQISREFATFRDAASFVSSEVAWLAEELGEVPDVRIRGSRVVVTLGLEAVQVLAEGDFDFAEALDAVIDEPADGDPADGEPDGGGPEPEAGTDGNHGG